MKTYKIYTLSCAKTKDIKYVGCTTLKLNSRLSQHLYNIKIKPKHPLYQWMLNNEVVIDLLDEVENDWKTMEKYWICQVKSWGHNLFNIDKGGRGINKGVRKNTVLSHHKKVDMYSPEGKFIKTYQSIKEAVKENNLRSSSSITNILNQEVDVPKIAKYRKTFAGGYRWAYHNEKLFPVLRYKIQKNGDIVRYYWSILEAGNELGFSRDEATKYLKGRRGPIDGFRIEYDIV